MAIKIPKELPLDQACLLSCCVPTGWGSAVKIAKIAPRESVAIWGMGGIGLNIVQGARLSGADPIIAVDIEGSKEEIAVEMGATHFINNSMVDPVPLIREITLGKRIDCAFEAVGDPGACLQIIWTLGKAGRFVVVGLIPMSEMVTLPFYLLVFKQQKIMGSSYGGIHTPTDIPLLADLAIKGELELKELISRHFILEEINEVMEAMENRKIVGRWVCDL
jgi:S-(hydroxymethyl)glutathione dehydrogenase/alcohol dehydrogenase